MDSETKPEASPDMTTGDAATPNTTPATESISTAPAPTSTTEPVSSVTPNQVPVTDSTQAAVTPPAPLWQAPQNQSGASSGGKSKKGLIIGIICGAVLLLLAILGVLGYLFIFSPAAMAKNTSTLFMHYMTTNDPAKAAQYSLGSASDLATFAPAVKGSYALSQSTLQKDTAYFLYTLTNAQEKYARTTVQKTNGVWKVSSFVVDKNQLKLVPGSVTTTTQTTTPTTTTTTSACLIPADYSSILNEMNGTSTTNTFVYTADSPFLQNVHFDADTLNFVAPAGSQEGVITDFANFYKKNTTKKFTIHLRGSVGTTAASDLAFANQRAQKVQSTLEADGVPAASIVIDAPQNVGAYGSDQTSNAAAQQTARNVVLEIIPGTNCTATSGNGL